MLIFVWERSTCQGDGVCVRVCWELLFPLITADTSPCVHFEPELIVIHWQEGIDNKAGVWIRSIIKKAY